nr:chemotaxis response regulator protein-glutamate methylesterase [Sediminibacillus massiliensis]
MKNIRVLIVDDSAFMRKVLSDILLSHENITAVDTARNGKAALEKVKEFDPDVVTMDIEMPEMNGLQALKEIMSFSPRPVLMLSSLTKTGAESTIKAMELGAVDFIPKPSGSISLDIQKIKDEIIEKVLAASQVPFKNMKKKNSFAPPTTTSFEGGKEKYIVAIGTSTGGPRALQMVLRGLPRNLPAPVVVVQHMPPNFTKSLANRLDMIAEINVKEAENGDILRDGTVYIAPGGFHMEFVQKGKTLAVKLSQRDPVKGHRPSVDVMFESIAAQTTFKTIAIVMTGMGSDGAKGVIKLKETSMDTIVMTESENTSVVYGMPKAVKRTGLTDYSEDLDAISSKIIEQLEK